MKQELELTKEYARLATTTADALLSLKDAVSDMNETNILHVSTLKENTTAIANIERFWGKIVLILVIAIAILAGVEKFGKLIGL